MACIQCERCGNSIKIGKGFSHSKKTEINKKYEKCYVCSEMNLQNAEIFMGVTFCCSCAQRIFQSCNSVKKKKQRVTRGKKVRSRRLSPVVRKRRHETSRPHYKKPDIEVHHVIELSQQVGSSSDSYHSEITKKPVMSSKPEPTAGLCLQLSNNNPRESRGEESFKKDSVEIGVLTNITQELLKEINACFRHTEADQLVHKKAVAPIPKSASPMISRKNQKANEQPLGKRLKPVCSDLRVAEIGASTEIANMALRKKSEVPIIIQSNNQLKAMKSFSESFIHEPAKRGVVVLDSAYGSLKDSEMWVNCLDGGLTGIMKVPLKFFKKNILNRSSLVSLVMTTKHKVGIFRRLKNVFYDDDVTEQKALGVKRLYSTINRRKTAYKMGWLHLVSKVSRGVFRKGIHDGTPEIGCKHYKTSESYRCMRDETMKLAGPTRSQLACIRKKIRRYATGKCVRDKLKCLYNGNLSVLEEQTEYQVQQQVAPPIQNPVQEAVQKPKQAIQQIVQKSIPQQIQQSISHLPLLPARESNQHPAQKLNQNTSLKPVQYLSQRSAYTPIITRQPVLLLNRQPYQSTIHQPLQRILQQPVQKLPQQPIIQPNYYYQTVYQASTNHNTANQKGMGNKYGYLATTMSC